MGVELGGWPRQVRQHRRLVTCATHARATSIATGWPPAFPPSRRARTRGADQPFDERLLLHQPLHRHKRQRGAAQPAAGHRCALAAHALGRGPAAGSTGVAVCRGAAPAGLAAAADVAAAARGPWQHGAGANCGTPQGRCSGSACHGRSACRLHRSRIQQPPSRPHALPPGGGFILVSLSPQLAGACAGVFAVLWVVTVIYGSYSRHSQRVVQVRAAGLGNAWLALVCRLAGSRLLSGG